MQIRRLAATGFLFLTASLAAQQLEVSPKVAKGDPYGVPLVPPIYLINFLFLYVANPDVAANMPAYRAPVPQAVFDCLKRNPTGCPYVDLERYFADQDSGIPDSVFPKVCRSQPKWDRLAPPVFTQNDQINEPLGMERAQRTARLLGIDEDMILTPTEYRCLIGTPGKRTEDQKTINSCIGNLTNSNGNSAIPLSSYGLSVSPQGDVRSNCAPDAACLNFNALLTGPLQKLAFQCGFLDKFVRMVTRTPFIEFAIEGSPCQKDSEPTCIVKATELKKQPITVDAPTSGDANTHR
jgi:hypothetical protein